MLYGNSQLLVSTLEGLPLLNGRYSNLKLKNVTDRAKRGNFSLVFKAFDELESRNVAIKFFDLDPRKQDPYRQLAFEREHSILTGLLGASRCLQVASNFERFDLEVPVAGQADPVILAAPYFVTEWIESDIDECFLEQQDIHALTKLQLFHQVVLAVESLHSRKVFHRDLKPDNFRQRDSAQDGQVVAIDLGTAARLDSAPVSSSYDSGPVGYLMYSAPEAFCGLAGSRNIAPLTDMFALGCMLFELFHPDDYPTAYRQVNPDFDVRFSAVRAQVHPGEDETSKLDSWSREASKLFQGLGKVSLAGNGSSAPLAVADLLTELVSDMTEPNFLHRLTSFEVVRGRCRRAIRILESAVLSKKKAQQAAARRAKRAQKAVEKAARAACMRVAVSKSGGG